MVTVLANRISNWGIASLVLLLGGIAFGEYNLYLYDHGGKPLLSFAKADQLCVVVHLASFFCGVMAMRRGSKWCGTNRTAVGLDHCWLLFR
jgi:hypothetical protein